MGYVLIPIIRYTKSGAHSQYHNTSPGPGGFQHATLKGQGRAWGQGYNLVFVMKTNWTITINGISVGINIGRSHCSVHVDVCSAYNSKGVDV